MAALPISTDDAESEIKALIAEKGMEVITSKMVREHLETKFSCNLEDFKTAIDDHIESCIEQMVKPEPVDNNQMVKLEPVEVDNNQMVKPEPVDNNHSQNSNTKSSSSDESHSDHDGLVPSTSAADVNANSSSRKRSAFTCGYSPVTTTTTIATTLENAKVKMEQEELLEHDGGEAAAEEEEDMASAIKRRRRAAAPAPKRRETKKTTKNGGSSNKNTKQSSTRKRNSMFTKICALSPELAALLGTNYMRRAEVVKQMWEYFRSNELMDPKNKQFVVLNEPLKRIFGNKKTRIKAFGMMSGLTKHVISISALDPTARAQAEIDVAEILAREEAEEEATKATDANHTSSTADENSELKTEEDDSDADSRGGDEAAEPMGQQHNGESSQNTEEGGGSGDQSSESLADGNNNGNAESDSSAESCSSDED